MIEEDMALEELWRLKEQISLRHGSVHEIAAEARRVAKAEPLPKAGKHRKMIPGFPRGQSVADPDPILQELWRVKDALAERFGYDLHRLAEYLRREDANWTRPAGKKKPSAKKGVFRSGKSMNQRNSRS